jgi:hypothetical protein
MFTMPLPKDLKEVLTIDYNKLYKPPLNLPRNITDEFDKVMSSGDSTAIDEYYREVVLPYNYSADLEREDVRKWDKERSVTTGKKGGEADRDDIDELHLRWRATRDSMKRKNKGIKNRKIAIAIERDQEGCYYAHRKDPTKKYSFHQIYAVIRTQ